MSLLVKITLSAALILSIAVPFGAFAAGERTKGRYKTALAANVFLFFGTMIFAAVVMFSGNAAAAEAGAQAAGSSAAGMEGMEGFGTMIRGFDRPDAILAGSP